MKYFFTFLLILFASLSVYSQDYLEDEWDEATIKSGSGPHLRNYTYIFLDYSLMVGKPEGGTTEIEYGLSHSFSVGLRHKIRLTKHYSLGFDIYYSFQSFHIAQNELKTFPNTELHEREKMTNHVAGIEFFNRLIYSRKPFRMGNFIDLGGYLEWAYMRQHYTRNLLSGQSVGVIEVYYSDLDYVRKFNYGLRLRFGFNRYIISASYRLSDTYKISYEMPRLMVGLQLGLHR